MIPLKGSLNWFIICDFLGLVFAWNLIVFQPNKVCQLSFLLWYLEFHLEKSISCLSLHSHLQTWMVNTGYKHCRENNQWRYTIWNRTDFPLFEKSSCNIKMRTLLLQWHKNRVQICLLSNSQKVGKKKVLRAFKQRHILCTGLRKGLKLWLWVIWPLIDLHPWNNSVCFIIMSLIACVLYMPFKSKNWGFFGVCFFFFFGFFFFASWFMTCQVRSYLKTKTVKDMMMNCLLLLSGYSSFT